MIARALNALGLMTIAKHEELTRLKTAALDTIAQSYCGEVKAATDWEAKFKLAATDLAKQAEEIENYRQLMERADHQLEQSSELLEKASDEMEALRPDALLWRAARKKRAARKGSVS